MSAEASIAQSKEVELNYPRQPGERKAALLRKWESGAPFGNCPACGSIGMEISPGAACETAEFSCSDDTCRTTYQYEKSGVVRLVRHTEWKVKKPEWWRERRREDSFWSWNSEHFPLEVLREYELI